MTGALKAALREAFFEWCDRYPPDAQLQSLTSALARRGVVVADKQHVPHLVPCTYPKCISTGAPCSGACYKFSGFHEIETPAPKPKRAIVQMVNDDGREIVLCNDGSMFWNDIDGNWRAYKPIPQPRDEP